MTLGKAHMITHACSGPESAALGQVDVEMNHLGLSLNQCEWPAVGVWPSSTCFWLYISESCFVKTGVFALQHVSTTKLK